MDHSTLVKTMTNGPFYSVKAMANGPFYSIEIVDKWTILSETGHCGSSRLGLVL